MTLRQRLALHYGAVVAVALSLLGGTRPAGATGLRRSCTR
jgi:hypothetical protein